jgi:hypothetical protein
MDDKLNLSLVNIECPEFLEKAAAQPAQEAGRTLANIFYAIFNPINFNVEKLRIKQSVLLKKFENDIKDELSKIPEEKLTEPKLNIVGPSIENSKFYIEDDRIRRMFAKLIASSMNIDTQSISHPAFVEFIKQLSPLDASNFKLISTNTLPIAKYSVIIKSEFEETLIPYIFLSNPSCSDIHLNSTSISNLIRLGLISVSYSQILADEESYSVLENHEIFKSFSEQCSPFVSSKFVKGIVEATPLGLDFSSLCL